MVLKYKILLYAILIFLKVNLIRDKDILRKRAILLTTKMRFSPEIQPIKELAIDRIMLQIIFSNYSEDGLSKFEIERFLPFETYGITISPQEIGNSLKRLETNKKIISESRDNIYFYKLDKRTKSKITEIEKQADINFKNVLNRIFKNTLESANKYYNPFLKFLCVIFSKLGEEYVRMIKGDIDRKEFLSYPLFQDTLISVQKEFPRLNKDAFEKAVTIFFKEKDPDFNLLKWNMAQSYYISKALGFDPSGSLLSEEIFSNASFYLDTNILISALEPNDEYHISFLTLNEACKKIKIKLKVCQITLDELNNWISYQYEIMNKTVSIIPEDLSSKIYTTLYRIYIKKKKSNKNTTVEDIFENFIEPLDNLQKKFNVELVDDKWFEEQKYKYETKNFAEILKNKYQKIKIRLKTENAALHDSLILLWIKKAKEENSSIWLATEDRTLPRSLPPNYTNGSLAITLEALLQWISPLAIKRKDEENKFTSSFADIIRNRLLPRERLFELRDFLIFHEFNIACNELPSEDVENFIEYIKSSAPFLNPLHSKDREKLAYEVNKFFLDPGRKYKKELINLEGQLSKAKKEYKDKLEEFKNYKEKIKKERLKYSGIKRLVLIFILFIILVAGAIYLANSFGAGDNIFQKVHNSWYFIVTATIITIASGILILGKKRLDALGWRFKVLFKK